MRSTGPSLGGRRATPPPVLLPGGRRGGGERRIRGDDHAAPRALPFRLVFVDLFLAAVVAGLALPAPYLGVPGLLHRRGPVSGAPRAGHAPGGGVLRLRGPGLLLPPCRPGLSLSSAIG